MTTFCLFLAIAAAGAILGALAGFGLAVLVWDNTGDLRDPYTSLITGLAAGAVAGLIVGLFLAGKATGSW